MADRLTNDPLGLSGRTLGDTYKLHEPIGAGGFGTVYSARHLMLNRRLAVKVLRVSASSHEQIAERFRREAEACWRLRHAGAVEVYDCRVDPKSDRLFFAMELLRGRSLADHWLARGRLSAEEAVSYVLRTARCVAVAHGQGIIHRDLKPENVFICEDGDVRVLDFGSALMTDAARLTRPGQFIGTTCYMPEEQLLRPSGNLDGRVDTYALGVVLYHLLSGKMVYPPADDVLVLRGRILRADPKDIKQVAPWVEDELAKIVRRAMSRDRENRYATRGDFADALAQVGTAHVVRQPSRERASPCVDRGESAKTLPENVPVHVTRLSAPTLLEHREPTTVPARHPPVTSMQSKIEHPQAASVPPGESCEPKSRPRLIRLGVGVLSISALAVALLALSHHAVKSGHEQAESVRPAAERAAFDEAAVTPQKAPFAAARQIHGAELRSLPAVNIATPQSQPERPVTTQEGRVHIVSYPASASVWLAGRLIGRTPIEMKGTPDQPILVRLELDGFVTREETATPSVAGGEAVFALKRRAKPTTTIPKHSADRQDRSGDREEAATEPASWMDPTHLLQPSSDEK